MTYSLVFDVSERVPDVLLAIPAGAALAATAIILLHVRWRRAMRRLSGSWLAMSSLPWVAFQLHNVSGPNGLAFAAVGAILAAGFGAYVLLWGYERDVGMWGGEVAVGSLALAAAGIALAVATVLAASQSPALALREQLDEGRASVVQGPVQDHLNSNWSYECFSVSGHRFCYDNSSGSPGFHQTHNNGGPIHDGLDVRVTYIGDEIVRLEIADSQ
jgi:hypothetical protein